MQSGTVRINLANLAGPRRRRAVDLGVWIDGAEAGRISAGREVDFPLPPGIHRVQLRLLHPAGNKRFNSETVEILIRPDEIVGLDADLKFGRSMLSKLFFSQISLTHHGDLAISAPAGSPAEEARVLGIAQLARVEEWLGEEVRLIDNGSSPAPVTRMLKASREWTRTLTLDESHRRTRGGEAEANLLWLSVKGSLEAELQRTLSLTIGGSHLFEEQFSITVPEHTAVQIVLGWKRIWQCGEAHVLLPNQSVHVVPYRVVVNVTFDQRIQDMTGH